MIKGMGGIRLQMNDDGANEEDVGLVPEKGEKAETNTISKSGCGVWYTAITRVAKGRFAFIRSPRGGN